MYINDVLNEYIQVCPFLFKVRTLSCVFIWGVTGEAMMILTVRKDTRSIKPGSFAA